jgi:hypothetical protein
MLPVKPLSGFSCGLEVSHKALLISYKAESAIIIVPPHGQSQPVQFPCVNCLVYLSLVLLLTKLWLGFALT